MESPESATVLAGFLGNGGHPPLHIHDADLFYVVLEGSATVRLGHGHHQAKAGEVIYIPAGYPHGSDNQSGAAEHHLEILTPGVGPGQPFMADVRQQVALSLITGFENFSVLTPSDYSADALNTLFDQVIAWSAALAPVRQTAVTTGN
jgi:hypothetical protein